MGDVTYNMIIDLNNSITDEDVPEINIKLQFSVELN